MNDVSSDKAISPEANSNLRPQQTLEVTQQPLEPILRPQQLFLLQVTQLLLPLPLHLTLDQYSQLMVPSPWSWMQMVYTVYR